MKQKFLKEPKCITCKHFAHWDGDYVCMLELKVFDSDFKNGMFDDKLYNSLPKKCINYAKTTNKMILEMHMEAWLEYEDLAKEAIRLESFNKNMWQK